MKAEGIVQQQLRAVAGLPPASADVNLHGDLLPLAGQRLQDKDVVVEQAQFDLHGFAVHHGARGAGDSRRNPRKVRGGRLRAAGKQHDEGQGKPAPHVSPAGRVPSF